MRILLETEELKMSSASLCGRVLQCTRRLGGRSLLPRRALPLNTVTVENRVRQYSSNESDDDLASKIDPGLRLGDYPVLPRRSAQLNKQTGWWDNQDRRDRETPLHEEDDGLNVWMFDAVENNGIYTKWDALAQFIAMFSVVGILIYLSNLYDAPSRNPAVPKQYPFDNLYLERGGDPNKPPTEEDKTARVKSAYANESSCS